MYDDAPTGSPPEKTVRIEYLLDLFAEGRYRTRETAKALAAKWAPISWRTIMNDASEAVRVYRLDIDEYRAEMRGRADAMIDEARAVKDFRGAIQALESACRLSGLGEKTPPPQVPVTVQVVYPANLSQPPAGPDAQSAAAGHDGSDPMGTGSR